MPETPKHTPLQKELREDTVEALKALQDAVSENAEQAPEQKEYIESLTSSLFTQASRLKEAGDEEAYNHLVYTVGTSVEVTPNELIAGLTEGTVTDGDMQKLTADMMNDEIAALETEKDVYDRIKNGVQMFLDHAPAPLQKLLKFVGVEASTEMIMLMIATNVRTIPMLGDKLGRDFQYQTEIDKVAAHNDPAFSDDAVTKGIEAWDASYVEWEKGDRSAEPPSLFAAVEKAQEELGQAEENEKQEQKNKELEQKLNENIPIAGVSHITLGSENSIYENGDKIEATLMRDAVNDDLTLKDDAKTLSDFLPIVHLNDHVGKIVLDDAFSIKEENGKVEMHAKISDKLTLKRLEKAPALKGGAKYKEVIIDAGNADADIGFAKLKNGIVHANYAAFDHANELHEKANEPRVDDSLIAWKWNGTSWETTT